MFGALCALKFMNKSEAIALVEDELENSKDKSNPIDCIILNDQTIEKEWGWVFFYQSEKYIESKDFRDMLAGNAPIIVDKSSGKLSYTGTAREIEFYINEYEKSI